MVCPWDFLQQASDFQLGLGLASFGGEGFGLLLGLASLGLGLLLALASLGGEGFAGLLLALASLGGEGFGLGLGLASLGGEGFGLGSGLDGFGAGSGIEVSGLRALVGVALEGVLKDVGSESEGKGGWASSP